MCAHEAKYSLIVSRAAAFFLAWVFYIWLCVQDVAVRCGADGICKAWDAWDVHSTSKPGQLSTG